MPKQHMSLPLSPQRSATRSSPRTTVDILVVNAADFLTPRERQVQLVVRIADLAQGTKRSTATAQGLWILLMIHTSGRNTDELEVAKGLSRAVSFGHGSSIWGVRAVEESTPENTAYAALCLHQLHFPTIADAYRSNYILVLGSTRECCLLVH